MNRQEMLVEMIDSSDQYVAEILNKFTPFLKDGKFEIGRDTLHRMLSHAFDEGYLSGAKDPVHAKVKAELDALMKKEVA